MAPTNKIVLSDKVDDGEMDLSMCDLQEVPVREIASYRKVWSLDLSNNHLVQLSKIFPTLKNLTKLDLSKNKLKILPENFGDLSNLKHLDLYKNELQHLPLSFANLKNLKWLDLKDNPLVPAIQEAAGDCLDNTQCQICATNIIYFFSKLKEKVDEERELREKQRQREKEKQAAEVTAQKSKPQIQEKKSKKKEPKQTQSQTKIKTDVAASGEKSIKEPPKEQVCAVKEEKHSIWYYLSLSFLISFCVLFIFTAIGSERTVIIEEIISQLWKSAVSYCPPAIQKAANLFADLFLCVHNKVGDFLGRSEDRRFLGTFIDKFQELFG